MQGGPRWLLCFAGHGCRSTQLPGLQPSRQPPQSPADHLFLVWAEFLQKPLVFWLRPLSRLLSPAPRQQGSPAPPAKVTSGKVLCL